ncbi:MAG: EscU/YscU/HrcU family type III secretion system export apparatus switch protein [Pseudomonadota bacterium]
MSENESDDPLRPLNAKARPTTQTAVAITTANGATDSARVTAAGRGLNAQKIIDMAMAAGVKIREDKDLAELLARVELDSPVPSDAFMAVAEILAYVYRANGQPNPFDAILPDEDLKNDTD